MVMHTPKGGKGSAWTGPGLCLEVGFFDLENHCISSTTSPLEFPSCTDNLSGYFLPSLPCAECSLLLSAPLHCLPCFSVARVLRREPGQRAGVYLGAN